MHRFLSADQVRRLRLRAQRLLLAENGAGGAAQVVRDLCAIQAQDAPAAALALRVRCPGLTAADVVRARDQERSIVRTWCMRSTLHFLPAEDAGWLLGLIGPLFVRANRSRRIELGLDDETAARAIALLRDELAAQGPLTRDEITARLARRGMVLHGQARPHLLGLAALQGMVCQGPMRGRQPTYTLLADWVNTGPALPRPEAGARLARRYLAGHAPATPEDFAVWSGLTLGAARAAWQQIGGEVFAVETAAGTTWLLRAQEASLDEPAAPEPLVRLLPNYDDYLLGYRSRELIVSPDRVRRMFPGGGLLRPVLLVNGWVERIWRLRRRPAGVEVALEPFAELSAAVQQGLAAEIEDLARFLGDAVTLNVGAAV